MPLWQQLSQEEGKNSEESLLPPSSSHQDVEGASLKSNKSKHLWILIVFNILMLLGTLTLLTLHFNPTYSSAPNPAPAPKNPASKQLSYSCALTQPHTHPSEPLPKHGRLWWIHLRHCTDILLQDLLCNANGDLITYQWVETQQNPFPDFSINRKCNDLGPLERWEEEHKAGVEWNVKKPEGLKGVKMEEGYFKIFPDEREE